MVQILVIKRISPSQHVLIMRLPDGTKKELPIDAIDRLEVDATESRIQAWETNK